MAGDEADDLVVLLGEDDDARQQCVAGMMFAAEVGGDAKLPVRSVAPVFGAKLSHGGDVKQSCRTIQDFFSSGRAAAYATFMTDFLSIGWQAFIWLFGEELREIGEGLELEGISGGVEEEHCGLLTDLAFEACVGFDDEFHTCGTDALGERLPVGLGEDDAEVGDGDVVAVDGVAVGVGRVSGLGL